MESNNFTSLLRCLFVINLYFIFYILSLYFTKEEPWYEDFVKMTPEVLFITELVCVVRKILGRRDIEASADCVREVDVLPVLPRLLAHAHTWCIEP